jgi:hypothetical protein
VIDLRKSPRPDRFAVRRLPHAVDGRPRAARQRTYSREAIVAALQRWNEQYGEPPTTLDWDPARARRLRQPQRAERHEAGTWPTVRMVCGAFASFNEAVEAAGLRPRRAPSRVKPNLSDATAITEAMVEWVRRYGDVPTMADWDPVRARRLNQAWRIARYEQDDWPSARSVTNHFGSFSAAVAAAGLVARGQSTQRASRQAARAENRRAVALAGVRGRRGGMPELAAALRRLAAARHAGDPVAVHAAVLDLASAALAYAEVAGAEVEAMPAASAG